LIFGRDFDDVVDGGMPVMVDAYNYKETPKHNYGESIAMRIRDHLEDCSETGVFRYYSYCIFTHILSVSTI